MFVGNVKAQMCCLDNRFDLPPDPEVPLLVTACGLTCCYNVRVIFDILVILCCVFYTLPSSYMTLYAVGMQAFMLYVAKRYEDSFISLVSTYSILGHVL